jgi:DNA-binding NarL/FixJ family response regulator
VCYCCGFCRSILDELPNSLKPEVLIQDIGLPGASGLDAIRMVKSELPQTEILMYSIYDDSDHIFKAFAPVHQVIC